VPASNGSIRTFAYKVAALVSLVVLGQLALTYLQGPDSEVTRLQETAHSTDILFFGDSTLEWSPEEDADKRSLDEMLASHLPDHRVGAFDYPAYHATVYEAALRLAIRDGARPQLVIVPINLRSFSTEWNLRPSYQFEELQFQIDNANSLVKRAAYRPLLSLHVTSPATSTLTAEEYRRSPVTICGKPAGLVHDYLDATVEGTTAERTRKKIGFHYLYNMSPDHRRLASLKRLHQFAATHQTSVLFYITPIDVENCKRHWGDEFENQIESTLQTIRSELGAVGAVVIDLSHDLPSDAFSYDVYPDEHLNEHGRLRLSQQIALASKQHFDVRCDVDTTDQPQNTIPSHETPPDAEVAKVIATGNAPMQ